MKISKIITAAVIMLSGIHAGAIDSTDRVVYGEFGKPSTFDPYTGDETAVHRISSLLFERLVVVDVGGDYSAQLAKSWEIAKDGSYVDFELKDNVKWHTAGSDKAGESFSANDVVETVRVIRNSVDKVANLSRYHAIKGAEKLSASKVRIYFNRALTDPLKSCLFPVLSSKQLANVQVLSKKSKIAASPVGTGPYRIVKTSSRGEVLLEVTDFYHASKPKIKTIVMQSFLDQSVMAQSLMYKSLDLVTTVSPRDLPELSGDQNLQVIPYESLSYSFIGMNTTRGILADKKVRRAIVHGVDRKAMLDSFFSGEGRLISGPFSPTSWAYNLDVKTLDYSPVKARELLKEAGLKDIDEDGYFEDRSGKKIELVFQVPISGRGETIKRIVLGFQNYMAEVGLRVDLKFTDWAVWKKKVLEQTDYDLTVATWSFDDANNISSLFHSSEIRPWGYNFVKFSDPKVDSLLVEAQMTNISDKRKAIYHKLHAMLNEQAPYLYLWSLKNHSASQSNLMGVRIEPFDYFRHIASWKKEATHGR